jgi:hypothetical protein
MKRILLLVLLVTGNWLWLPEQAWSTPERQQYGHDSYNEGFGDDDEPDITITRAPNVKSDPSTASTLENSRGTTGSERKRPMDIAALIAWAWNLLRLIASR